MYAEILSPLACDVLAIVRESGTLVRRNRHVRQIRHKGRIDLVTETDLAVEAFLKDQLGQVLPGSSFLAEESTADAEPHHSPVLEGTAWVIDPVDGTSNFAHGLPLVATSVALWQDHMPVLGVVNLPLMETCYVAEKGRGAWCNGLRMATSTTLECEDALVATGFPYDIADRVDDVLARLRPMLTSCQGIRRCGAAAIDLAWVAAGHFDAYYEYGVKPWDTAAGWLLVEEAGGTVTTLTGSPYALGPGILASNAHLHAPLRAVLDTAPTR